MSASALVCLAPGSEETEAVTTIDLMVRGGIKVTTASVASDGSLAITCSRGVKILADAPLVQVADGDYDIIVLPGGLKGAECFRDSPLLVETVRQFQLSGRIGAAICAAAGTVLVPHDIFPIGNMTGFPGLKDTIPEDQWVDKRVGWDPRVNLLPGGLKGAECFRDSPLLVETVRQFHLSGRIVAAICAAAGTVLVPHNIFPIGNMTGFPGLKDTIPEDQWVDKRVVWDPRVNLLTSQGPGTAIDFGLKIIDLLVGREKAYEVASSLVMAAGIYNYYE